MRLAFWRQETPEQQAARVASALDALSPELRSLVINHDGVQQDWVNASPLADLFPDHNVSPNRAFNSSIAVYTCVDRIATSAASLPIFTYDDEGPDRKRIPSKNDTPGPMAWKNGVSRLLHESPNKEMTAQEFKETMFGHTLLWGNHYSQIDRGRSGHPEALWPLRPDKMERKRDEDGRLWYVYTLENGDRRKIRPQNILHVRGMSLDGQTGVSPISVARKAILIGQAAETFTDSFYRKGVNFSGMVIADPPLTGSPEKKREELKLVREGLQDLHGGATNAHRVAALSGVKWQEVGMPLKDAQFLETRKWQLLDIARLYHLAPYKVGITDPGAVSYASVEQQNIEYVTDTLRPWLIRAEEAMNRDLGFSDTGITLRDQGVVVEFLVDALLRGSTADRYAAYATALDKKFMVVNEVRAKENLPPVEWGEEPNELPGEAPVAEESEPAMPMQPLALVEENDRVAALEAEVRRLQRPIEIHNTIPERRTVIQAADAPEPQDVVVDLAPVAGAMENLYAALHEDQEATRKQMQAQMDAILEATKPRERRVERDADGLIARVIELPVGESA